MAGGGASRLRSMAGAGRPECGHRRRKAGPEGAAHPTSSGRRKLQRQPDTTARWSERPQSRTRQHQVLTRTWGGRRLPRCGGGGAMRPGATAVGASLAGSHETKPPLTAGSRRHAPGHSPEGPEDLHPHKSRHTDIRGSLIRNRPVLGATRTPLGRRADEYTALHPDNQTVVRAKHNNKRSGYRKHGGNLEVTAL